MKYRQLGTSELQVPVISLGSWLTYSGGVEKRQAIACVHKALDLGINFFDTANVYGRGAAESVLGEALKGIPRHSYSLATKVFFPMSDIDRGLSRAQIVKQLDASLKRLGTDYIDLYQCHRHDADTPLQETMGALTEAVRQGKTRYIGFSEWPLDKIDAAASMPGVIRFVSSQPQYSMLWPAPQDTIFPRCAELGIGQIVWSPLAQGVLTGKYQPGAPPPRDPGPSWIHGRHAAGTLAASPLAFGRTAGEASRRTGSRSKFGPIRAFLGAAPARGGLGDHWRIASRASGGERRGGAARHRTGAFRQGRGHSGAVP